MRLFVAVMPPQLVLAELTAAVAPLKEDRPDLRWTSEQAWHLTLAFLGEVDEAVLPDLTARLARAAGRHPVQQVAFRGAGAFPRPARAQVLWVGLSGDEAALGGLAASVAAASRRAGAPPPDEGRRFRPHVTLARCRGPADVRPLVDALAGFAGSAWTAREIRLVRSDLGQGPPKYTELGSWPLRQGG
jgi:RNA 2',3'-cyclic 3'-phosphodiesterase